MDNFSMVGTFAVLANNKDILNIDGCLWYFDGISSSLKAEYFGHTNKTNCFCFWRITEWTIYIPVLSKESILKVMTFYCRHSNSESSKFSPHAYVVKSTKILPEY